MRRNDLINNLIELSKKAYINKADAECLDDIVYDILEDIDIEPYGNSEITIWKKKWKNEKKNIKEIILVDENDKEYKFDIPEEITVK